MAPVPQNSLTARQAIVPISQTNQPFYQTPYFIAAVVAAILLILLVMCRVCALRRSRRSLSNFFVRRRGPGSWPGGPYSVGTPYDPYRPMPLSSVGMAHRSPNGALPAATGENGRPLDSFYSSGGFRKEPLPVYDNVGGPPQYVESAWTTNGPSADQPSSEHPRPPLPTYQGLRNS